MIFDKKLKLILFISIFFKLIVIYFFHEKALSDEWLTLFNNFEKNNSYSYYVFEDEYIPSSYMPPLYFFFLYFNKLLSFEVFNFLYLVYFFQILLSTISVILFYKICKNFLNTNYSLLGALIFSIFPLIVYSNALISSVTLQLFLYLSFFYLYFDFYGKNQSNLNIFLLSLVSASCLILRGEFLIIFLFSIFYLICTNRKKLKSSFITVCITLLLISPYIIRNYINTNKPHIVSASGYALWKGNNHLAEVEGFPNQLHPKNREVWPAEPEFSDLYKKLDMIEINKKYETNRDEIFANEAIKNILLDKKRYSILYVKKIFSYFFIDLNSSIKNYDSPAHVFPLIIFGTMSIPGIFITLKNKKDPKIIYIFLVMILLTLMMSIFFILPRYKISILSFQILFSLFFIKYLISKLKK